MSFLLISGPADQAEEWVEIGASARSSIKSQYAAAGIKLVVSAFGSTDAPTSTGADPVGTANTMAAWVKEYDLDGIDVDYEVCDFPRCWPLCILIQLLPSRRTLMPLMPEMAKRRPG